MIDPKEVSLVRYGISERGRPVVHEMDEKFESVVDAMVKVQTMQIDFMEVVASGAYRLWADPGPGWTVIHRIKRLPPKSHYFAASGARRRKKLLMRQARHRPVRMKIKPPVRYSKINPEDIYK